jgi:hypothetical protein
MQELYGCTAAYLWIFGFVDNAHSAFAQLPNNAEVAEIGTNVGICLR